MSMKRPTRRSESGETYIELLVTVVIIGLAGVALMGALMTSIQTSSIHRNIANTDSILKSALEKAKYEIELAPSSVTPPLPMFQDCGHSGVTASSLLTSWNSTMTTYSLWPSVPTGIGSYKMWISGVECFTESTSTSALDANCQASQTSPGAAPSNVVSSGCTNDYSGIMQVTVSVMDPDNQAIHLSTLVRNPNYAAYSGF